MEASLRKLRVQKSLSDCSNTATATVTDSVAASTQSSTASSGAIKHQNPMLFASLTRKNDAVPNPRDSTPTPQVFKYSKHCGVCDKCVDSFDHHCRLILQWSTGIYVLICCIIERKHISVDISTKLGSSFSFETFVIVVAVCTLLAMFTTLRLAQLFFFHILLIKKGIITYDYIIPLREQEQEQQGVGGLHSPQMSPASSLTGLSSASSFTTFHRNAWCTPLVALYFHSITLVALYFHGIDI